MARSGDTYLAIENNIIYEDKISDKKDRKEYIGCLVQSKYADGSDDIKFYLFESKIKKSSSVCLDLIEYEKAESCTEQRKGTSWIFSNTKNVLFPFQLIPKHQQQKQIFVCKTEDHRNKWLKMMNDMINKLNTNGNYTYNLNSKVSYDENYGNEYESVGLTPSRSISKQTETNSSSLQLTEDFKQKLNYVLLKSKKTELLNINDIFYEGTFDELFKILLHTNKPGVYAVINKVKPEFNCTMALRVYEDEHTPISSWNIYQNQKTKQFYLFEDGPNFVHIVDLCIYYTKTDLPIKSNKINRLTVPYTFYDH